MAFRARKVVGTFVKRAPALLRSSNMLGARTKKDSLFPTKLRLPQTFKRQSAMSKVFISVIVGIFKVFYFKMYRLRMV